MTTKQINNCVKAARKHVISFNKTYKILHLQQAGNKIYKAYVLLVENISKKDIRTTKGVRIVSADLKDKNLYELGRRARYLHSFWYEGKEQDSFIKNEIKESIILIKMLLKKYKIK